MVSAYDKRLADMDQARRDGIEKGIVQNKVEIAQNMLEMKMDISTISKVTGLSIEKIMKIQKNEIET